MGRAPSTGPGQAPGRPRERRPRLSPGLRRPAGPPPSLPSRGVPGRLARAATRLALALALLAGAAGLAAPAAAQTNTAPQAGTFTTEPIITSPGILVSNVLIGKTGDTVRYLFFDNDAADTSTTVTVTDGPVVHTGSRTDVVETLAVANGRLFFQTLSNAELDALTPAPSNPFITVVRLDIEDTAGNASRVFPNYSTGWNPVPSFVSAKVTGTALSVTFDETVDTDFAPASSVFHRHAHPQRGREDHRRHERGGVDRRQQGERHPGRGRARHGHRRDGGL